MQGEEPWSSPQFSLFGFGLAFHEPTCICMKSILLGMYPVGLENGKPLGKEKRNPKKVACSCGFFPSGNIIILSVLVIHFHLTY